ncbi:SMP-30/gluconolactonase/LRE family protein [Marinovum sp.]|uniref:SMP-30/gluconolactonase/LRE family protein n=1 Tax=Marinovum sp. TaxID=2024839 RepID=UPI002B27564B|nr:SMP-30/gluconolactonase/LRE family protein [Marinovum sp.]
MTDMNYDFTLRHDAMALTAEVPLWDADRGCLWWADIQGQRLLRHVPGGADAMIALPGQCGLIALGESGRLVLGLENGLFALDPEAMTWDQLSDTEADAPERRLNDGKPDRQGRLWFGSMDMSGRGIPTGGLFRRDREGRIEKVLSDIAIPNAIVGDPTADAIWFTDTPSRTLERLELDAQGGIARRITLLTLPEGAHPDGMSMDAEGLLWLALVGPGELLRIDPASGDIVMRLTLPVRRPTMAVWGDDTLYVTSQRRFLGAEELCEQPHAGNLLGAQGAFGPGPVLRVAGV